jgi:hypothetical protein
MPWIGSGGAAAVTGARWSAGAYWADAGSPSASDSDWEDPADWPRTYASYDLTLGVFVAGVDVTGIARGASWSLGQSDLWAGGLSVSSCSLRLKGSGSYTAGDRVVVLTDVDVLWTGIVETPTLKQGPDVTDETTLSCSDDLGLAGLADVTLPTSRTLIGTIERLLAAAGITAVASYVQQAGIYGLELEQVDVAGPALEAIAEAAEASNASLAWAPGGVKIYPRSWHGAGIDHVQLLEDAGTGRTRSSDAKDVRNAWTIGPAEPGLGELEVTIEDPGSILTYGRRSIEADYPDRWSNGAASPGWGDGNKWTADPYRLAASVLGSPPERLSTSANIVDADDEIHRVLPMEISDETFGTYLILAVSHDVSVDAWGMGIEAIEVIAPATQLLRHVLETAGVQDVWGFDIDGGSWISSRGTELEGGTAAASIIPAETVLTARTGAMDSSGTVLPGSGSGARNLGDWEVRDGWSVSLWFKDSLSDALTLVELSDLSLAFPTIEITTAGAIQVSNGGGSGLFLSSAGEISANTLHHLVVRSDSSATTVYLDGAAVTPVSSAGWSTLDLPFTPYLISELGADGGVMLPALFNVYLPDAWAAAHYALRT